MTRFLFAAAILMCSIAGARAQNAPSPGQPLQSPAGVQRAVDNFLRAQTAGIAGHTTFSMGALDTRLALPACGALDVFVPSGGKLWGNSSVGVRCGAPTPWTIYVPVTVRVNGPYIAATRAISAGQALGAGDVTIMQGDLTQLPAMVVTDLDQALGKTLGSPLSPGQPLRADALRIVPAIQQGQTVRLVSQGQGFRVTADGKALANAAVGQLAQVRTASGQTVSGIAKPDGSVEVNF